MKGLKSRARKLCFFSFHAFNCFSVYVAHRRLELSLLKRVLQSQVVVLAHQRKHQRHEIALERKPRNYPFVKWFVSRQQNVDRDFEPGSFRSLTRMIKSGQFGA